MDMERPYFDDLKVGDKETSAARTIGEADILQFAMLSGDWNPVHVDAEFAKGTPFGQRIAHGLLGLAVSTGLRRSQPVPHVMAFLSNTVDFKGPIFIGDTVHMDSEILEMKPSASKPDRGVVVYRRKLINQRGEVVQDGTSTLMIQRRPRE